MATAIFLMLSGNGMQFTSHTVEGDTYHRCLGQVLTELSSPCMWEVYDHEVVIGKFVESGPRFVPTTTTYAEFTEEDWANAVPF